MKIQQLQQQFGPVDKKRERELRIKQELDELKMIQSYNPFGKGGGGAPMRDSQGNVITLRKPITEDHDNQKQNNYDKMQPGVSFNYQQYATQPLSLPNFSPQYGIQKQTYVDIKQTKPSLDLEQVKLSQNIHYQDELRQQIKEREKIKREQQKAQFDQDVKEERRIKEELEKMREAQLQEQWKEQARKRGDKYKLPEIKKPEIEIKQQEMEEIQKKAQFVENQYEKGMIHSRSEMQLSLRDPYFKFDQQRQGFDPRHIQVRFMQNSIIDQLRDIQQSTNNTYGQFKKKLMTLRDESMKNFQSRREAELELHKLTENIRNNVEWNEIFEKEYNKGSINPIANKATLARMGQQQMNNGRSQLLSKLIDNEIELKSIQSMAPKIQKKKVKFDNDTERVSQRSTPARMKRINVESEMTNIGQENPFEPNFNRVDPKICNNDYNDGVTSQVFPNEDLFYSQAQEQINKISEINRNAEQLHEIEYDKQLKRYNSEAQLRAQIQTMDIKNSKVIKHAPYRGPKIAPQKDSGLMMELASMPYMDRHGKKYDPVALHNILSPTPVLIDKRIKHEPVKKNQIYNKGDVNMRTLSLEETHQLANQYDNIILNNKRMEQSSKLNNDNRYLLSKKESLKDIEAQLTLALDQISNDI